jgi:hypothetical protein
MPLIPKIQDDRVWSARRPAIHSELLQYVTLKNNTPKTLESSLIEALL